MTTRRLSKVGEAVRETVSSAIVLQLRDPRVKNVTVLRAEVTSDLRWAKVFVTVMGPDNVKALTMKEPPAKTFAHMLQDLYSVPSTFIACLEWQRRPNAAMRRDLSGPCPAVG